MSRCWGVYLDIRKVYSGDIILQRLLMQGIKDWNGILKILPGTPLHKHVGKVKGFSENDNFRTVHFIEYLRMSVDLTRRMI